MAREIHVIGNGDSAPLYLNNKRHGIKLACNQIQFEVPEKWATVMVDFKMMDALTRYHNGDRSNGLAIPLTVRMGSLSVVIGFSVTDQSAGWISDLSSIWQNLLRSGSSI